MVKSKASEIKILIQNYIQLGNVKHPPVCAGGFIFLSGMLTDEFVKDKVALWKIY